MMQLDYDEMEMEHEFEHEEYEIAQIVQAILEQDCQECFVKICIGDSIIKRGDWWCGVAIPHGKTADGEPKSYKLHNTR